MFFFLSWWLVKVESWWITWPWTSIRGFKSLAMTLFFARCRYWNWHQTADKVTGQVLEIDNRQSGAKNKLSDLVFLSGKYHISLTFPRGFGFVWRFSSVICYYISITVFDTFKKWPVECRYSACTLGAGMDCGCWPIQVTFDSYSSGVTRNNSQYDDEQ